MLTVKPTRRHAMAPAAIQALGLTKGFGRVIALDGLDLDVCAGEIFGFLSPNGADKSTTIRLLLGLIRPTAAATSSSATSLDVPARA
jgi:ABC-type multidrug transport system ATPase subunit